MSKHYKQLKKLSKRSLGLTAIEINKEIDTVKDNRDGLSELLYTQSENVIAAEVIADMVTNYHLKNIDKSVEVNIELSAKCESTEIIIKNKSYVSDFFSSSIVKELSEILSTISLYSEFLKYGESYADDSLTLHVETLLESGKLQLVLEGKELSEDSLKELNKIVLNYLPTYEQKFIEFLPTYMSYKDSFETIKSLYIEDGKGTGIIDKTRSVLSDVQDFSERTKLDQLGIKTELESGIRKYKLSFGELNISDKNIISKYGVSNLKKEKESLISLQKENESIDDTITSLVKEKNQISQSKINKDDSVDELNELLDGIDTSYIVKNSLISLSAASETHRATLSVYSGVRIGAIINQAAKEGKFFVEVFELTDIEAKIVLDKGYELLESTESIVRDPNNIGAGRKTEILTTWTISWENANSFASEEGVK